jgi:hypothetical protein
MTNTINPDFARLGDTVARLVEFEGTPVVDYLQPGLSLSRWPTSTFVYVGGTFSSRPSWVLSGVTSNGHSVAIHLESSEGEETTIFLCDVTLRDLTEAVLR